MQTSPRGRYRSVFVSDVHLGCRFAQTERFLNFLNQHTPQYLYLVGDFIDGWRLGKRWHWQPSYCRIVERLLDLTARGVQIRYTPGNHDAFVRRFPLRFGPLAIADEFRHCTADGREFVVLHGDRFDRVERGAPWLSALGCVAHDVVVRLNRLGGRKRSAPRGYQQSLSAQLTRGVSNLVRRVSDFEQRIVAHASAESACGVICGHMHIPCVKQAEGVTYCNTGDWVEHCTALVEHGNGSLELLHDLGAEPAPRKSEGRRRAKRRASFELAPALSMMQAHTNGTAETRFSARISGSMR